MIMFEGNAIRVLAQLCMRIVMTSLDEYDAAIMTLVADLGVATW